MKTTIIACVLLTAITIAYSYFIRRKKKPLKIHYDDRKNYSGKNYFDICDFIGSPLACTKDNNGIVGTWILKQERVSLSFDDDMNFKEIVHYAKIPKVATIHY